jgi:hypothetical protein
MTGNDESRCDDDFMSYVFLAHKTNEHEGICDRSGAIDAKESDLHERVT